MTFAIPTKLLGSPSVSGAEELFEQFKEFSSHRKNSVGAFQDNRVVPKTLWKIQCCMEGILHRTVALCDGVVGAWNGENFLSSIILARSVMETSAVAFYFYGKVDAGVEAKSIELIDEAAMDVSFTSRYEPFKDISSRQIPNIVTLIDKLRNIAPDKNGPDLRKSYDWLSEYAHPNYPGTMSFFGILDQEKYTKHFSEKNGLTDHIAANILAGFSSFAFVEFTRRKMERLYPVIEKIVQPVS
ncbi:MAG: hypothetical protein KG075_16130 [Alphaproteobacteria bacterium]|nr:hypothetical protein [Alphaproteobacteria bacterium]